MSMKTAPVDDACPQRRILGMSQNVFVLGLISFFADMGGEAISRSLPLFLSSTLGVKTSIIGLIEGIADTTATVLKIFSGWISDRLGKRKPIVLWGYCMSGLSRPLYFFAASWPFVLALRFTDRAGKGIRNSARDALLADSSDPEHQGRAFGWARAMDPLGAVVGLLIAAIAVTYANRGAMAMTRGAFQSIVLAAVVPSILMVALLALFVRDVPTSKQAGSAPSLSLTGFDSQFRSLLLITVVFTLGNSTDAFLVLRARDLGLDVVQVLALLALFSVVASLTAYPAGVVSDRLGRRGVIIAGWTVYGLIYLGFAFAQSAWHVWVLYSLYGAYYGLTEGAAKALVADVVPSAKRGTAYGLYNAAIGISALPASVIAGALWQRFGAPAPFIFGAVLALAATLMLLVMIKPGKGEQVG
ncbi:MAG: MFS transporter [Clostridia bacterium]|nr:MFS transporter [Clostridia bacterium]